MDILDRFLVREFLRYFVLVTVGISVLFLGIDFLANMWKINLPMGKILIFYVLKIPEALQQFLPLGCLLGVLLVLAGMSRQNEILALYSSGVGGLRIVSTFVAIVATVSTLSFLVFDSLVPTMTKMQLMLRKGVSFDQEGALFTLRTGLWYRGKHMIYNVGRFVPQTNTLEKVSIYRLNPSFEVVQIIHSQKATFINDEWILEDGSVITYDPDTRFPTAEKFAKKAGVILEKPGDFKTLELYEGTMRLRDLRKYIDRNRNFGLDTISQQVHYHERVALVFAPLVFLLLAVPFALKPLKSYSMPKSIGLCFLIVFLYLLMFRMSLSVGKGGHIPPVVSAWTPNLLFLGIAGLLITRKS